MQRMSYINLGCGKATQKTEGGVICSIDVNFKHRWY